MAKSLSKTQATIIAMRHELKKNFEPGEKFYSGNEAAERYDVSTATSKVALAVMVSDGLLDPVKGSGHFVI